MKIFTASVLIGGLAVAPRLQAQSPLVTEPLKVETLPFSLERIQRKLAQAPATTDAGLKLDFHVDVYGKAPHLDFFADFDLKSGPIQYGGPTHNEFLWVVTPEEFRSPPADFGALLGWLVGQLAKKTPR